MSLFEPITRMPLRFLSSLIEIFPFIVKVTFLAMIGSEGYINRERFSYIKYIHLQVFLDNFNLKAVNQVNYKIKYKAFHDYKLYNNSSKKKLYHLLNKTHLV
jgi:hypothetical protein